MGVEFRVAGVLRNDPDDLVRYPSGNRRFDFQCDRHACADQPNQLRVVWTAKYGVEEVG